MHEHGIVKAMLELVLDEAEKIGKTLENSESTGEFRIKQIKIMNGELAGYLGDPVRMYFKLLSKGTAAEGARLSIRRIPVRFVCRECAKPFRNGSGKMQVPEPSEKVPVCRHCGGVLVIDPDARNFFVESITVDRD